MVPKRNRIFNQTQKRSFKSQRESPDWKSCSSSVIHADIWTCQEIKYSEYYVTRLKGVRRESRNAKFIISLSTMETMCLGMLLISKLYALSHLFSSSDSEIVSLEDVSIPLGCTLRRRGRMEAAGGEGGQSEKTLKYLMQDYLQWHDL